jgi:hypothetical protein
VQQRKLERLISSRCSGLQGAGAWAWASLLMGLAIAVAGTIAVLHGRAVDDVHTPEDRDVSCARSAIGLLVGNSALW